MTWPSPRNATLINADLQLDLGFAGLTHFAFGERISVLSRMRQWDKLFDNLFQCDGLTNDNDGRHSHDISCTSPKMEHGVHSGHGTKMEDGHGMGMDDGHGMGMDSGEGEMGMGKDNESGTGMDSNNEMGMDKGHGHGHGNEDMLTRRVAEGHSHGNHNHEDGGEKEPVGYILSPIFWDTATKRDVVGFVVIVFHWSSFVDSLVSVDTEGIDLVISDSCGSVYTYYLAGGEFELRGSGDMHDTKYDHLRSTTLLEVEEQFDHLHETCTYVLDIYPSSELEDQYVSNHPLLYALVVPAIFSLTAIIFMFYDWAVKRRKEKITLTAKKTEAIISSIFPKNVRARLLEHDNISDPVDQGKHRPVYRTRSLYSIKTETEDADNVKEQNKRNMLSKPIADLFLDATVMFADIDGFNAWSSTRQPSQVFELLEGMYGAFDGIARRHKIFKVETVGDCYVAVAGLPEQRADHAVAMARFSAACLSEFCKTSKQLVVQLGPDTEEMALRIGLHSGP